MKFMSAKVRIATIQVRVIRGYSDQESHMDSGRGVMERDGIYGMYKGGMHKKGGMRVI